MLRVFLNSTGVGNGSVQSVQTNVQVEGIAVNRLVEFTLLRDSWPNYKDWQFWSEALRVTIPGNKARIERMGIEFVFNLCDDSGNGRTETARRDSCVARSWAVIPGTLTQLLLANI